MNKILRGKSFVFFITALILILWYSSDKEQRNKVLQLRNFDSPRKEFEKGSAEVTPLDFATDLAKDLEVPPTQIAGPSIEEPKDSNFTLYNFHQEWAKYPVFESELILKKNQNSKQITVLKNNFKKIENATLNTRYSKKEVQEILKSSYKKFDLVGPMEKTIFVQDGQGELAYQFTIEVTAKGRREVVVSAVTSEVLLDRKKIKN